MVLNRLQNLVRVAALLRGRETGLHANSVAMHADTPALLSYPRSGFLALSMVQTETRPDGADELANASDAPSGTRAGRPEWPNAFANRSNARIARRAIPSGMASRSLGKPATLCFGFAK
jgi:hypothetical protein